MFTKIGHVLLVGVGMLLAAFLLSGVIALIRLAGEGALELCK